MNKVGNLKSEQLKLDGSIVIDDDQAIVGINNHLKILKQYLGDRVRKTNIDGYNYLIYTPQNKNVKSIILLTKSITYMGGNGKKTEHPSYLNRIQLPKKWKEIVNLFDEEYDVRFLGIYHYEGNFIFTDVVKDSYLNGKMNNSAAHIYMNDLVQAQQHNLFKRIDFNNNILISISKGFLQNYFEGDSIDIQDSLKIIKSFNQKFLQDNWLVAIDNIKLMHRSGFPHWKEGEWPGWLLEYRFSNFLKEKKLENITYRVGDKSNQFSLDLDLWINDKNHFADLKSSNSSQVEVPGNDLETVEKAIKDYGKLWYIVYEHETIKDKDRENEQTKERNNYIYSVGEWKKTTFNELSYHARMKHSVKYSSMFILELTELNFRHYTKIFNQGKQPDGSARNKKIKFSKRLIENAIIYREFLE